MHLFYPIYDYVDGGGGVSPSLVDLGASLSVGAKSFGCGLPQPERDAASKNKVYGA